MTADAFLGGALTILQPKRGFRAGIDSVLLAAAVPAFGGESALEAGSGPGVAALCLAKRVARLSVTGLERDPASAALSAESAAQNGLQPWTSFHSGSVEAPPDTLKLGGYDHLFANPPFLEGHESQAAADPGLAAARLGPDGVLKAFVDFCLRYAGPKGSVTLVHRADSLDRILEAIGGRLGALKICPLWPKSGVPAKRVIVQGRKGSRAPLTLLPGLTLHRADGAFTSEAEAILRHGAPLTLETEKTK